MNRMIRSILFGGAAAIALTASTASAHDVERGRPHPAPFSAPARVHIAPGARDLDRDRVEIRREYRELAAARAHFSRGWHGDRHDRHRFERWYAVRRVELGRRWAHHGRG
jgi:hypothetical protein